MRRAINTAARFAVIPVPADIVLGFDNLERNIVRLQILGRGQARGAGADDAVFVGAIQNFHLRSVYRFSYAKKVAKKSQEENGRSLLLVVSKAIFSNIGRRSCSMQLDDRRRTPTE
jgi:hypothetical protein